MFGNKSLSKNAKLILIIILSAAAFLRFYKLGSHAYWLDEAFTLYAAIRNPLEIIRFVYIYDTHPPLHFLLVHLFTYFGTGEFIIRSSSAIFGVASVWTAFLLGREVKDEKTGLLSAGLHAFSSFAIPFSQEARMYPHLNLFILLSAYHLLKAARSGKEKNWVYFVISSVAGVYIDYRMLLILAGGFVYFLIMRKKLGKKFNKFLIAHLQIGVLSIPALVFMFHQAGPQGVASRSARLFSPPNLKSIIESIFAFFAGNLVDFNFTPVIITTSVVSAVIVYGWTRVHREKNRFKYYLPFCFLFSFLIFIAYSLARPSVFSIPHMIFLLPFFLVIFSMGLEQLRISSLPVAIIVILIYLSFNFYALYKWYHHPAYTWQDFRSIAAYIRQNRKPGDKVVIFPEYQRLPFFMYYRQHSQVIPLEKKMLPRLEEKLKTVSRVWWIFSGDEFVDPDKKVRQWMEKRYFIKSSIEAPNLPREVTGKSIQVYLGVKKEPPQKPYQNQ